MSVLEENSMSFNELNNPRLVAQPFVQAQIKENIKAPCH